VKVRFRDADLERLESEARLTGRLSPALARQFRKVMQQIRSALDERELRTVKGYRFEQLRGNRAGQYSIRLNDQFRLIFEIEGEAPNKTIVIVEVEDYH
jgi:proteic killer suppression protein